MTPGSNMQGSRAPPSPSPPPPRWELSLIYLAVCSLSWPGLDSTFPGCTVSDVEEDAPGVETSWRLCTHCVVSVLVLVPGADLSSLVRTRCSDEGLKISVHPRFL